MNDWALMLDAIYGGSQNYAKTPYEIHAHLTEVCGIFAKHLFKKKDTKEAEKFLPKIFAWSIALLRKTKPEKVDLESLIFRKFPDLCPYCLRKPCSCWNGEKPTLKEDELRAAFYRNKSQMGRSINDYQLMFREIYQSSWKNIQAKPDSPSEIWKWLFIRLIEEVAEVGEALRFHHLYPENFENEFADLMAWWFALVTTLQHSTDEKPILAEDLLWGAYPGNCPDCQMVPCLCRPGPVRQLMSRPIPGHDHRFDSLTSLFNQAAYNEDIKQVEDGILQIPFPSACARLDVDNFKVVNDTYGHAAGDQALSHIASVIRQSVRERDRVYRISGDEFGILFANYTEEEASGAMRRVCKVLLEKPVRWVNQDGAVATFPVSVSIGVSEFANQQSASEAFTRADNAAYKSKSAGKGRVTRDSA